MQRIPGKGAGECKILPEEGAWRVLERDRERVAVHMERGSQRQGESLGFTPSERGSHWRTFNKGVRLSGLCFPAAPAAVERQRQRRRGERRHVGVVLGEVLGPSAPCWCGMDTRVGAPGTPVAGRALGAATEAGLGDGREKSFIRKGRERGFHKSAGKGQGSPDQGPPTSGERASQESEFQALAVIPESLSPVEASWLGWCSAPSVWES